MCSHFRWAISTRAGQDRRRTAGRRGWAHRPGAGLPRLAPRPVQAADPTIRRVTWLKKPEVHWEPHFTSGRCGGGFLLEEQRQIVPEQP